MGFSVSKTVRLGPVRLTLSNRGLGVSWGLGPVRFGRSRGRGTTTVRVPGTGWTWRSSGR